MHSVVVEAHNRNGATLVTGFEVLEARVFDSHVEAATAQKSVPRGEGARVVHVNIVKLNYRIDAGDDVVVRFGESRVMNEHFAKFNMNIGLIVPFKVGVFDLHYERVLQRDGRASQTRGFVVHEAYVVRDVDGTQREGTEDSLVQSFQVANLTFPTNRNGRTEEQAEETAVQLP